MREESVSDITGKTLQLVQILNSKEKNAENEQQIRQSKQPIAENKPENNKTKTVKIEKVQTKKRNPFGVNKWLLIAAVVIILGNIGLFFIAGETASEGQTTAIVADKVNLENSILKEHLESARLSSGIFYGRIAPSWNGLSKENKERFLQKVMSAGNERGFSTVHLLDSDNKPVAYVNGDRVQINE